MPASTANPPSFYPFKTARRRYDQTPKRSKRNSQYSKPLPEGVKIHGEIFQAGNLYRAGDQERREALRDRAILVAIVLFFLLNSARPLSPDRHSDVLRLTAIVFNISASINTMTLGGLAVAISELVDDAIVDVENVFRRFA